MFKNDDVIGIQNMVGIVRKHKKNGRTDWKSATKELNEFFKDQRTSEGWRAQYRLATNEDFAKQREQGIKRRDDKRQNRYTASSRVQASLKKTRSVTWLMDNLGLSREKVYASITELQLKGANIVLYNEDGEEFVAVAKKRQNRDNVHDHKQTTSEIVIAVISDTHLGSRYQQLQSLNHFYEYAHGRGVKSVYHVGDISDGWYPHRQDSYREVHRIGYQEQLEYVANVYPSFEGMTTYFITGRN